MMYGNEHKLRNYKLSLYQMILTSILKKVIESKGAFLKFIYIKMTLFTNKKILFEYI